jgi:hypothetical protein
VQKGSTQTNKRFKLGTKIKRSKDLSVLWTSAPDCPVCHRTVSGAPCPYKDEPTTLGKTGPRSTIIHQTVQCASGATTNSCNGRLCKGYNALQCAAEVRAEVRGAPDSEQDLSGVAPNCPVPQGDNGANGRLLPNPNGWVTWQRTGQSTVPVRCAHRQQPSPTAIWWLRAINTLQPPPHQASKHSEHCIQ